MKKFLAILLAVLMAICCFALAACDPSGDGGDGGNNGGTPGGSTGGGGTGGGGNGGVSVERQEEIQVFRSIAAQAMEDIGLSMAIPSASGNNNFRAAIPNKMTETTDEGRIRSIKVNTQDSIGIMYLLSLLYANENYVMVDGYATFDFTMTIFGQSQSGTMTIYSKIDKENDMVYFEPVVSYPQFGVSNYTFAVFNYDFDTDTLISSRFTMGGDGDYSDCMLTGDGTYTYYVPEGADEFTAAVDALIAAADSKISSTTKLTANFDAEILAYTTFFEAMMNELNGTTGGGVGGGDNVGGGGVAGGDDVIQEGTTENDKPMRPTNSQVDATVWSEQLAITEWEKGVIRISKTELATNMVQGEKYIVWDGDVVRVSITDNQGNYQEIFYSKEGANYYSIVMEEREHERRWVKTQITEQEYDAIVGEFKVDYSLIFSQGDFTFNEMIGCYQLDYPNQDLGLDIYGIMIWFAGEQLSTISYNQGEYMHNVSVSNEQVDLILPE